MSYAHAQPMGYLGAWDQRIPESEGAAPETYQIIIGAVRSLPSGTSAEVPDRIGLFLRNTGVLEFWRVNWISGGRIRVQYRARRGTDAYRSGVERRRVVEGALNAAAQSLGPSVQFAIGPQSVASRLVSRDALPWVIGGIAAAGLLVVIGGAAFVAGTSVEGVRRERVRANRRRRRRRR